MGLFDGIGSWVSSGIDSLWDSGTKYVQNDLFGDLVSTGADVLLGNNNGNQTNVGAYGGLMNSGTMSAANAMGMSAMLNESRRLGTESSISVNENSVQKAKTTDYMDAIRLNKAWTEFLND